MNIKPLGLIVAASFVVAACNRSAPGKFNAAGSSGGRASSTVDADFHTLKTPVLAANEFELMTLSTMPDTVTDGDVLVAVRGLAPGAAYKITRNGEDVSVAFSQLASGEVRGLVSGLKDGANLLGAESGGRVATLEVKNHPITGPVISGPHQTPFFCRLEDNGLVRAPDYTDANCLATTKFEWFYRARDQSYKPLADPYAAYPNDVVMTQLLDGRAVPFVVRVESATINRGIVRMAVLDDPAARGADAPFATDRFNGRVYHAYGESCGVGYQQGSNDPSFALGGSLDPATVSADRLLINLVGLDQRLGKGDVTVHSTLAAFGVHCNPIISIESVMMIKEHISEQYGLVRQVVGTNGSGAALQQYNAINSAPGLLAAGMPTATFADIVSTAMTVTDCGLLQNYYATRGSGLSQQQRQAINGHNFQSGNQLNAICQSWTDAFYPGVVPDQGCPGQIPEAMRYNPQTNRSGVRCTIQDANVNIYGRDPATGFARRPVDNIGIQYGLGAFNDGTLTFDEFLALNRDVGGIDMDGRFAPERHAMDAEVERITYQLGGVIGRGALTETPVMDFAPYLDLIPTANIHEAIRPFTVRARLKGAGTQSIWRGVVTQPDGFVTMDEWLANLAAADVPFGGDHTAAVAAARPASAADHCSFGTIGGRLEFANALFGPLGIYSPLLPGVAPVGVAIPLRVDVPESFDTPDSLGPCGVVLAVTRTPRMVAGMPLTDDIIKCQLKSVSPSDYSAALSKDQLDQISAVFPTGVCDYTKPAAGDVEKSLIWPSLGGATLEAPHELKWRVARSG